MQSVILNFFTEKIKYIKKCFSESVFAKIFFSVCDFVCSLFKSSIIGRFVNRKTDEKSIFKSSIFGKIILLFKRFADFLSLRLAPSFTSAKEGSKILKLADSWYLLSVRVYGFALLCFSLSFALLRILTHSATKTVLLFCGALFVFSLILILINRSLKALYKGSFLLKALGGIFYENKPKEKSRLFLEDDEIPTKSMLPACLFGVVLSLLFALSSPLSMLLSLGAFAFLLITLKHTSFGVIFTIALAPLLPTMVLAGLSILCAVSFFFRAITTKGFKFVFEPLYIYCALFLLAYLLGTLNSFTFIDSAKIFMLHAAFILFFFVAVNIFKNKKMLRVALCSFLCIGAAVSLYGIAQNFLGISGASSWVDENMFEDIKIRVYSTFGNPNVLGEFLVLLIPLALVFALRSKKNTHKLFYFCILAVSSICLILTWSRGAWLGAMLAVILCLVAMDKRWTLCAFVLVIALPFVPVLLQSNSAIVGRITSIGDMADSSTAYRVSIWRSAIDIIKQYWIGGIGPGSEAFSLVYQKYAASGAKFALHSHNLFLQLAVELGVGGLLLFLALVVKFCKQSVSSLLDTKNEKTLENGIIIAGTSGILGLLLQGLTDYIWYNYKMLLLFWIVTAFVTSLSGTNQREKSVIK